MNPHRLQPLSLFHVAGRRARKARSRKERRILGETSSLSDETLPICVPAKV
jgi:hypothetical protein